MSDKPEGSHVALEPDDPYAREAQTFPRLSAEMVARIAAYGTRGAGAQGHTHLRARPAFGRLLPGSRRHASRSSISDPDGDASPFTVLGERQFTGELDLFNDRQILVSGRAGADSRVVRIKRADFRRLVTSEPDIGEIIMRAFILRRVGLDPARSRAASS